MYIQRVFICKRCDSVMLGGCSCKQVAGEIYPVREKKTIMFEMIDLYLFLHFLIFVIGIIIIYRDL